MAGGLKIWSLILALAALLLAGCSGVLLESKQEDGRTDRVKIDAGESWDVLRRQAETLLMIKKETHRRHEYQLKKGGRTFLFGNRRRPRTTRGSPLVVRNRFQPVITLRFASVIPALTSACPCPTSRASQPPRGKVAVRLPGQGPIRSRPSSPPSKASRGS